MNIRRLAVNSLAIGLLATNFGCGGGDSPTTPTVTATPVPAPTTTTILSGSFVGIGSFQFGTFDFSVGAAGSVTATANWTFGSNDVDIFVVSGTSCTTTNFLGRPTGAGCTILCEDTRVGGNSASCTVQSTSGTARLFVVNLGPGSESGTYNVTLTR